MRRTLSGLGAFALVAVLLAGCSSGGEIVVGSPSTSDEASTPDTARGATTSTTMTTTASSSVPKDPEGVYLSAPLSFGAGEPGKLSVVAVGPPRSSIGSSSVGIVVRNNTNAPLYSVEANVTARDAAGGLLGSGTTQGFEPAVVRPGEWSYGFAFFGGVELPENADLQVVPQGDTRSFVDYVQLPIVEASSAASQYGGTTMTVVLSNPTDQVIDHASGLLACFTPEGVPLDVNHAFVSAAVPAKGTTSSSEQISGDDPCPVWVLAYSAFI
jgi:hypothetical protein